MYTGMHVSHRRTEPLFKFEWEGASEVEVTESGQESLVAALAAALGSRARRRKPSCLCQQCWLWLPWQGKWL